MASVLFSCFGTTDPVRGYRDGGMMHIMRHYRPDVVYLFLTDEIVKRDGNDHRIDKTFAHIREKWGGYAPRLVRFETGLTDPSDMDALVEPMEKLLDRVLEENPKTEILLNLSSGTPQMQIILAQMALDSRYPTKGIQVKSPERSSGRAARTNMEDYPVDVDLELNEDEEPDAPNRCCVPKMIAVRREAVRNQLRSLVSRRNYAAIAQMGADLPRPIPQLAKHLDYRSRFLLNDAEAAAAGLSGMGLLAGKGDYSYRDYEMIEYFAMLKHLVYLKRYTDFMLRLNPYLIRLQLKLLGKLLEDHNMVIGDLLMPDRERTVRAYHIAEEYPALLAFAESELHGELQERAVSIRVLNLFLEHYGMDSENMDLLKKCERGNEKLRNAAAHDLFTVTNDLIYANCGMNAENMIAKLEQLMTDALSHYADRELKKRINVYDRCDRIILDCL